MGRWSVICGEIVPAVVCTVVFVVSTTSMRVAVLMWMSS